MLRHTNSRSIGLVESPGTEMDRLDMQRMGKKQELRRNFSFLSIFGYSMILMSTWETAIAQVDPQLIRLPQY